jgi:hypothetical protein
MTRPDWLAKYPRAAALLQGDEDVLDYTPDPGSEGEDEGEGEGDGDGEVGVSTLEISQITYEAARILKNALQMRRQNDGECQS